MVVSVFVCLRVKCNAMMMDGWMEMRPIFYKHVQASSQITNGFMEFRKDNIYPHPPNNPNPPYFYHLGTKFVFVYV